MDVDFPFPTLKQLSMVRVTLHLANEKIGCFSNIFEDPHINTSIDLNFIDSFSMPPSLKSEIADIITGIHDQMKYCVIGCRPKDLSKYQEVQFLFDVYGVLDESLTWGCYFEKKIAECDSNRQSMLDLLEFACYLRLLPQIDLILQRYPVAEGIVLNRTDKRIENHHLVLHYQVTSAKGRCSAHEAFPELQNCDYKSSIHVVEDSIKITLFLHSRLLNIQTFKESADLLSVSARRAFAKELVALQAKQRKVAFLVDIYKFQKGINQALCLPLGADDQQADTPYHILKSFLVWPFLSHFITMVNLLKAALGDYEYSLLFDEILRKIPIHEHRDLNHSCILQLLLQFLNVVPESAKNLIDLKLELFS